MSNSEDEGLIHSQRTVSNKAIKEKDTTTMASIWTEDFHVITSRNADVSGRIQNRDRFAAEFAAKPDILYVRTPDIISVFKEWNMAAESGSWVGTWTENGKPVELKGSYYAKWHKVNGKWLIRAEIFTPLTCSGGELCDKSPI